MIWKTSPRLKPTLPGVLSSIVAVPIALKCKDQHTVCLLGELLLLCVRHTGFVTNVSHSFKSQLMAAQPLTEKRMLCF